MEKGKRSDRSPLEIYEEFKAKKKAHEKSFEAQLEKIIRDAFPSNADIIAMGRGSISGDLYSELSKAKSEIKKLNETIAKKDSRCAELHDEVVRLKEELDLSADLYQKTIDDYAKRQNNTEASNLETELRCRLDALVKDKGCINEEIYKIEMKLQDISCKRFRDFMEQARKQSCLSEQEDLIYSVGEFTEFTVRPRNIK